METINSLQQIVVATSNKHKLAELQTIGAQFGIQLLSPVEIQSLKKLPLPPEVDETANTFYGNALLKAEAFYRWCGVPALGDDSGLEVEALDGAPGIHSARYAGVGASDKERIDKLLCELEKAISLNPTKTRRAQFRSVLVLVSSHSEPISAEGILTGHILQELRGTNGFGYDPIVWLDEIGATLAEVDFSVTCTKGFRAKGAHNLFSKLIIK